MQWQNHVNLLTGFHVYASSNGLIAQMTSADQTALLHRAKTIQLKSGDNLSLLHPSENIFFPTRGSIALYAASSTTPDIGLAVGLIGAEGAVGLQIAMGFGPGNLQLLVQSAGEACMVHGRDAQRLLQRRKQMLLDFSHYLWTVYQNIATLASQGYTQDIKARLAHWLLLSAERCAPDSLFLKHEEIAKMLGVRRSSISIAAHDLKLMRYISYNRGYIKLLNIDALKVLAST